jgi:hypothetical protein
MMYVLTKATLVVLAGVYTMRATNVMFNPESFNPMSLVAMFAFVMSFVLFNRLPTAPSIWAFTVVGLCLFGVVANSLLYFRPDAAHASPTNMTFSAVSIVGWAIVALYAGLVSAGLLGKLSQT